MKHVLFVCTLNISRSATAEREFASYPGIEVCSAGTSDEAEQPLTDELVRWADVVIVMEERHRAHVLRKFKRPLGDADVACLGIPDCYWYQEPALLELLRERVPPILERLLAR